MQPLVASVGTARCAPQRQARRGGLQGWGAKGSDMKPATQVLSSVCLGGPGTLRIDLFGFVWPPRRGLSSDRSRLGAVASGADGECVASWL